MGRVARALFGIRESTEQSSGLGGRLKSEEGRGVKREHGI